MRFAFTDDQLMFRDAVREFLAKECPPEAVRRAWEAPADAAVDRDRWRGLAEMGVLGLMIPEAQGGMGLTELDLVLLLEETGRAALPEPIVDVAAVGGPLLAELPAGSRRDDWLARVASGDALLGVQSGSRASIAGAPEADLFLLARDDEVHAVDRSHVHLTPQESVDGSRKLALVDWHRRPETLLVSGAEGWATVNRAFDRGALAVSAQLLGLADRMLTMTVEYVNQREQFGVPVGSFQAVKHRLADALLALEFARPVVYRAAYSMASLGAETQRSRDVSMAKIYAATAAHQVGRAALQCHGAIGYTVEYDLHLFMKRAWALESVWAEVGWHRDRVAAAVLGSTPPPLSSRPDDQPLGETLA
jgi:alkylation response protein AidB-like acyl-CoA dehydrogenase